MCQKTCGRSQARVQYFEATHEVALYLKVLFKYAFPEYFAKYVTLFDAGVWEECDPGPWIGRAIVFKLQVDSHVDRLDDGPTAAFPVGFFHGGELYLPDLSLKLR